MACRFNRHRLPDRRKARHAPKWRRAALKWADMRELPEIGTALPARATSFGETMALAKSANRSATTPKAPGGLKTNLKPGDAPDRSTIPGQWSVQAPAPLGAPIRPAVQYLTAQELSNAMPIPDEIAESKDFEQASASDEENRKAYPWQTPPRRPTAWFTLGDGVSASDPVLEAGPEALALAQQGLASE